MANKIKAILIDSGRVLNNSVTGHWFITPNFFNFVNKETFNTIPNNQVSLAFRKAHEYISKQNLIVTEEDEYKHFLVYYKIFFENLPQLILTDEQIQAVTRDLVYNYDKYKFYQDAIDTIPNLSENYKLAVVSDAWPSLENVFKKAGMRDYFSSFVVSSIKGILKPDELMYKSALDELNVLPHEAIFIDDNIKNCDGAKKLGIESFLLCRDLKSYIYYKVKCKNHRVIRNLSNIKSLL